MHKKRKGGEKSVGFVSTVGKEKEIQVGTNSFVCLGCRSLAKKAQLILRSGDAEAAWVAAGRSTVSLSFEDFKMIRDVRAVKPAGSFSRGRGRKVTHHGYGSRRPRERVTEGDARGVHNIKDAKAKGACFNCFSAYHLERNCPEPRKRH